MILYIENPKDATGKLLELINESGKVPGYKINAQKSLAFLHTNDEISEREVKEILLFTTATKRIKYETHSYYVIILTFSPVVLHCNSSFTLQ